MTTTSSFPVGPATAAPANEVDAVQGHAGVPPKPGFVWHTRVFFDDLDPMGMVHNAAYLVLIERATSAFFEAHGWCWERNPARNPDQHYVVREQSVRYLEPILGPGEVDVEMWVNRLGQTSASFGFEVRSSERVRAYAERVHVKLDPGSLSPAPWSAQLRNQLAALVRSVSP